MFNFISLTIAIRNLFLNVLCDEYCISLFITVVGEWYKPACTDRLDEYYELPQPINYIPCQGPWLWHNLHPIAIFSPTFLVINCQLRSDLPNVKKGKYPSSSTRKCTAAWVLLLFLENSSSLYNFHFLSVCTKS